MLKPSQIKIGNIYYVSHPISEKRYYHLVIGIINRSKDLYTVFDFYEFASYDWDLVNMRCRFKLVEDNL